MLNPGDILNFIGVPAQPNTVIYKNKDSGYYTHIINVDSIKTVVFLSVQNDNNDYYVCL